MPQKTLAAFGFTKKIVHRGREREVLIPENVDLGNAHPCGQCNETFKSPQGLAVHMKCKHGVVYVHVLGNEKKAKSEASNHSSVKPSTSNHHHDELSTKF